MNETDNLSRLVGFKEEPFPSRVHAEGVIGCVQTLLLAFFGEELGFCDGTPWSEMVPLGFEELRQGAGKAWVGGLDENPFRLNRLSRLT
jgi:hypothetical protein